MYIQCYMCVTPTRCLLFQLTQLLYDHPVYRIAGAGRSAAPPATMRSDAPPETIRSVAPPAARGPRAGRVAPSASSVSHSGGDECAVCMDETPNCVLVPCGHTCHDTYKWQTFLPDMSPQHRRRQRNVLVEH